VFFLDDFPLNALTRLTHYGFASLDGRLGVENDCHFGYEFVYVEAGSANLVLNEFEAPLCIAGEDLIITAPFVKRRLMKPAASFETSVMEHVESCLRLNFAKGVSLDELAKMSGYHPAYLCRKFKEKKGLPPRAHLNEYRIRAAKELLLAGKGAAETASLCGFGDASYFSHFFKRKTGLSPSAYAATEPPEES
jgi:AraC-like DNA-binding protein